MGGHPFIAKAPDGATYYGNNLALLCREHKLNKDLMNKVRQGIVADHRKWTVREATDFEIANLGDPRGNPKVDVPRDETDAISMVMDMYAPGSEHTAPSDPRELVKLLANAQAQMAFGVHVLGKEPPTGWNPAQINATITHLCTTHGIDRKHAEDYRTAEERVMDAMTELIGNSASIWEAEDEILATLEQEMIGVRDGGEEYLRILEKFPAKSLLPESQLPAGQDPEAPPGPKTIAAVASKWIDRIRRVRHLAHRAQTDSIPGMSRREKMISQATHTLRYQLYVNRSGIMIRHKGMKKKNNVFTIGPPHIRMSMGLFFSRNRYGITDQGILAPGESYIVDGKETPFPGADYTGTIWMIPPRHGKTDELKAVVGLEIGLNPRVQIGYVHDVDEEAKKFKNSVERMFHRDNDQGRRNYRLFPYELDAKQNDANMLRVKCKDPPKTPNLVVGGVFGSAQGLDLDLLIGDDLVPQRDNHQPGTRKKRLTAWAGTWVTRLQGENPHIILSGYPRHFQDLMWTKYKEALEAAKSQFRRGDPMWVLRMPVGDTKSSPKFKAIWDYYGPAALRRRYRQLSSRATWAANYGLHPITDDMKLVKNVRILDKNDPKVIEMLKASENHLNIDPAAKGDGLNDMAGLVVLSVGSLEWVDTNEFGKVQNSETLAVVRMAREFHATQTEITQEMMEVSQSLPIHQANVECVTGLGSAIIEILENYHGVYGVNPIGTGNLNKKARFKAVAGMLEHQPGIVPAKVAFLGEKERDENGNIIEDSPLQVIESQRRLLEYVVNYAVEEGFHSLDALTQGCRQLMPVIGVGEGEFSAQVEQDMYEGKDKNKCNIIKKIKIDTKRKQSHSAGRRRFGMSTLQV